jgi:septum formation protein
MSSPPLLVLASSSPRRAEILKMLGLTFRIQPSMAAEELLAGEMPEEHVERLARAKADEVSRLRPDCMVLGGDTVVVLDGEIIGKPENGEEAVELLCRLAGRKHVVLSGLALVLPDGQAFAGVERTEVAFRSFGSVLAERYVATGEPLDKAGAYGIQGLGSALVREVQGDYFNVVGLPLPLLLDLLERAGWSYSFGDLVPAP